MIAADIFTREWLRTSGVTIAIVLVAAVVVSRIGTIAVRRFRRRLEGPPHVTGPMDARRAATLATMLVTVIRVVVWTVTVMLVLGSLNVQLGPLLASAGIAGIAIGFGAQAIVKDFLAGFFILLEDQFAVGDMVELAIAGGTPIEGRVELVTLRATSVRALDGTLAVTGNGNVVSVRNQSRGRGELRVEVTIPRVSDLHEARRRLEAAVAELRRDDALRALLSSGPDPVDVVPNADGGAVAIVAAETLASRRQRAEDALTRGLTMRLLAPEDGSRPTSGPPR